MSREPLAVAVSSLPSALRTLSGLYGTVDSAPRRYAQPAHVCLHLPLSVALRGALQRFDDHLQNRTRKRTPFCVQNTPRPILLLLTPACYPPPALLKRCWR